MIARAHAAMAAVLAAGIATAVPAAAAETGDIGTRAKEALRQCFAQVAGCKVVGEKSEGILVFPEITQAAVGVGGAYGEGALIQDGKVTGHYSLTAGSVGLQLGAQKFSQVIMFTTQAALNEFLASSGWEADAGAGITWIDQGTSATASTIAADKPVVGFSYGEQGLMGAAAVGGSKISRLETKR